MVHGGNRFHEPVRIDPGILATLDALTPLALLHQPHCLSLVRAILSLRPDLLYHRSGLLGVSGNSGDMSELLASTAPAAGQAIELFVFRIVRELAATRRARPRHPPTWWCRTGSTGSTLPPT